MDLMAEAGSDIRRIPKILVSGPQTAAELERHLIKADVVPAADFGSKGLLAAAGQCIRAGSRVLRLASDRSGPEITDGLRAFGAEVTDCVLYRNEVIRHTRLPVFDDVIFLSASAVDSFVSQWGADVLTGRTVVAIGEPTAFALGKRNAKVDISPREASIASSIRALALFRTRISIEEIA
jgi:uroporphyrinogen-III synthase